jgi:predicted RecA/RadA family phage recombinase
MALNEIYAVADSLVFPVADTVVSGDLVQVGQIVGVAEHDAKDGEDGNGYATLKLTGAFKFDTADTVSVGAKCYVTSAGAVTTTSTSNKFIGHAIKAGTGYVVVRLVQN